MEKHMGDIARDGNGFQGWKSSPYYILKRKEDGYGH
jgi:hypothetical protein